MERAPKRHCSIVEQTHILDLEKDVMGIITSFLDVRSFFNCGAVCRKWREFLKNWMEHPTLTTKATILRFCKEVEHTNKDIKINCYRYTNITDIKDGLSCGRCGQFMYRVSCARCHSGEHLKECSGTRFDNTCANIMCLFKEVLFHKFSMCTCNLHLCTYLRYHISRIPGLVNNKK